METAVIQRLGRLRQIWTYPVKSLLPMAVDEIEIIDDGLAGDRRAALYVTSSDHARCGKTYRGKEDNRLHLLKHPDEALDAAHARGIDLEIRIGERHFDAGPISLIVDRWVAEVERGVGRRLDPLRWRPNLYVTGSLAVSEADLVGARVHVGSVVLSVVAPTRRCVTTTYDQVTGQSDYEVLRFVARNRDNTMGVYCEVEQAGTVHVRDTLQLYR